MTSRWCLKSFADFFNGRSCRRPRQGSQRTFACEPLEDRRLLSVSPVEVLIGGSAWRQEFADHLISSELGSSAGYSVPLAANQPQSLPWAALNKVSIRFSDDAQVDREFLSLRGVNVVDYAFSDFGYDSATRTATWTLSAAIATDNLLLHLADAVRDSSGQLMDGEFSPSQIGDGAPGGDFKFRFNVVPGDVDRDGRVKIFDTIKARNKQGTQAGDPNYSPFYDVDGTGDIKIFDTVKVRNNQSVQPPSGLPTAAPPKLFTELSESVIRENEAFGATAFLLFVDDLPSGTTLQSNLLHDGEFVAFLPDTTFQPTGVAIAAFSMFSDVLPEGAAADAYDIQFRAISLEQNKRITVEAAPRLLIDIPNATVREGTGLQLSIAQAFQDPIGNTAIYTDLWHDGEYVQSLPDRELGPDGSATIILPIPSDLLPDSAPEDSYELRVRAAGLEAVGRILITAAPELRVDLQDARIQEGSNFSVGLAASYGSTEASAQLFRDGQLIEGAFPGYKELQPDGTGFFTYKMPSDLLQGEASEDAFDLRFGAAGLQKTIRVVVTAKPELLVNLTVTRIKEGTTFKVALGQAFRDPPIGNTAAYAQLFFDGNWMHNFPDKQLGPDGTAVLEYTMPTGKLQNGADEDAFDLRFDAAGLEKLVRIVITKGSGDSGGTPSVPNGPKPPLAAPTSPDPLSLSVLSTSEIRLTWANAQNESQYKIYRWTSAATTPVLVQTPAANTTTWTDTGRAPSTTYFYRVDAVNSEGVRREGTPKSATTGSISTPTVDAIRTSSFYRDLNGFWKTGDAPSSMYPNPGTSNLGSALGNCTWYAAGRLREMGFRESDVQALDSLSLAGHRSAREWDNNAIAAGLSVSTIPRVGDVAQRDNWGTNGHVAIVEAVYSDGTILVSESSYAPGTSWDFFYRTDRRPATWFSAYIHLQR